MIYERLNFSYDIDQLREHLNQHVLKLPIVEQSPTFGGWSVTSSNGDYRDGWGKNHHLFTDNKYENISEVQDELKERGLKDILSYKIPTQICTGYLATVLNDLEEKGLYPRRARISRLSENSSSFLHRDAPDWLYFVRLHIPIMTNANCYFECEEGRAHLLADGSVYTLRVNRMHKVVNEGTTPRYHLIMDVWDTKSVSLHHRYNKTL